MNDLKLPYESKSEIEQNAKKIAFTGTAGTGKSTDVFRIIPILKHTYPNKRVINLNENAAHSPYKINKETTFESQLWIYTNQIQEELKLQAKYDILVCDRTIVDAIAYTKYVGLNSLADRMFELSRLYVPSYDIILFKSMNKNDYAFNDGVRDVDNKYRKDIEDIMLEYYNDLNKNGYLKNFFVI